MVAGHLGSYCYGNTCVDIGGWPQKSELPKLIAGDEDLAFSIDGNVPFVTWSASYGARANDDDSKRLGSGGTSYDPDATASPPPMFISTPVPLPPTGDWVVWVWVELESGDLSYAWHVVVP